MTSRIAGNPERQAEAAQEQQACVHYWIIDPPDGPVSKGICVRCGAVKEFENWKPKEDF